MPTLHLHCFAGISGDMVLGALIDLGVDQHQLTQELNKLHLDHWQIHAEPDERQGITGTRCRVLVDGHEESDHHHHHIHTHTHDHHTHHHHDDSHDHAHQHTHEHDHTHDHTHHHPHRGLTDIQSIIRQSTLDPAIQNQAIAIFTKLAEAEADVHGSTVDEVHFHEVGATDAIIDIVGVAIGLYLLNITRVTSSTVELGGGTVRCAHGIMPVPAPATARLLKGVPVSQNAIQEECTTPTGAAILAALVDPTTGFNPSQSGQVIQVGTGLGGRNNPALPNALQAILLEDISPKAIQDTDSQNSHPSNTHPHTEQIQQLSANIDDMTAEEISHLIQMLLDQGALDAWADPIVMKKSRPAVTIHALVKQTPQAIQSIRQTFFTHSTTLGLREQQLTRTILPRTIITFQTPYGPIRVKQATFNGKIQNKPEFDDCQKAAQKHNVNIRTVATAALENIKTK